MNYKYIVLLGVFVYVNLSAISIVYNFRIAQVTKQVILEEEQNCTAVALLFDQYNRGHDNNSNNFIGGLASFIYDFRPYYFRTDFAVSHITAKDHHTVIFTGTETDDLLFTLGRNFIFSDHKTLTLSALFGIPTHQILSLQHPQFGSGQVGIGIQLDGLCPFRKNNGFIYGLRYIHFIPRNAQDECKQTYRFTIGNVEDMLLAYKKNWNEHGMEFGYTSRFQFGADISPNLDNIVEQTNYIRSSVYAVYKYRFLINDLPNRFLFNVAYGHYHRPKETGTKYSITVWTAWDISF